MDELTHPHLISAPPQQRPLLCLGGSFNPPHLGHLVAARAAAEAGGFGGLRLIVAADPPHKPGDPTILDAVHRLEMIRRAVVDAGSLQFQWLVDDREIRRAGPSYTVQTARDLVAQEPSRRPIDWLIGADLLSGLTRWHEAQTLLAGDLLRFWVMRRGGYDIDWTALPPAVRALRQRVIEVPRIEISATAIRERMRKGLSIRFLVPELVEQYILENELYQGPK